MTFRYSATLGGFDDTPLVDFARDKEVIAFREHFYTVNEVPHVTCVVTYQDAIAPPAALQAAREIPPRPAPLRAPGYVRYMDDFALFGDDKSALKRAYGAIEAFAQDELKLALKSRATILAPVREGLPFLGWNLHRGTQRIRPHILRRLRRRLRHRAWERRSGRIAELMFGAALRSALTHLAHGDTQVLRRGWLCAFKDERRAFDDEL